MQAIAYRENIDPIRAKSMFLCYLWRELVGPSHPPLLRAKSTNCG